MVDVFDVAVDYFAVFAVGGGLLEEGYEAAFVGVAGGGIVASDAADYRHDFF